MVLPLAQATGESGFSLPLGGVLILVLLAVTALLIRNMAGRLKRLPDNFEPNAPAAQKQRSEEDEQSAPQ